MSPRRRRAVWFGRLLLMTWAALVLALLHVPTPSGASDALEPWIRQIWVGAGAAADGAADLPGAGLLRAIADDKVLHLLLFIPLGALCTLDRILVNSRRSHPAIAFRVLVVLLAVAVGSELAQGIGGRFADPADVLANLLGAAMGWLSVVTAHVALTRRG